MQNTLTKELESMLVNVADWPVAADELLGEIDAQITRLKEKSRVLENSEKELLADKKRLESDLAEVQTARRRGDEIVAMQDIDIEHLNRMLREHGYGQGSIDVYTEQCEEIDRLREENERLKNERRT